MEVKGRGRPSHSNSQLYRNGMCGATGWRVTGKSTIVICLGAVRSILHGHHQSHRHQSHRPYPSRAHHNEQADPHRLINQRWAAAEGRRPPLIWGRRSRPHNRCGLASSLWWARLGYVRCDWWRCDWWFRCKMLRTALKHMKIGFPLPQIAAKGWSVGISTSTNEIIGKHKIDFPDYFIGTRMLTLSSD